MLTFVQLVAVWMLLGGVLGLYLEAIHYRKSAACVHWGTWIPAVILFSFLYQQLSWGSQLVDKTSLAIALGLLACLVVWICLATWFAPRTSDSGNLVTGAVASRVLIGAGILVGSAAAQTEVALAAVACCFLIPWLLRETDRSRENFDHNTSLTTALFCVTLLVIGQFGLSRLESVHAFKEIQIPTASLMMMLILVGLGGLLEWFPFPTIHGTSSQDDSVVIIVDTLLPCMSGAFLLLQTVQHNDLEMSAFGVVAVVALFSMLTASLQLFQRPTMDSQIRISSYMALSGALLAVVLVGWENTFPMRQWNQSSNVPTGLQIFTAIIVVESIVILITVALLLRNVIQGKSRIARCLFSCCRLSLAGFPPLPGSWWRFLLIASLLLPHNKSFLTNLTEPDAGFITLSCLTMLIFLITVLGHTSNVFQEQAIRTQDSDHQEA